MKCQSKPFITDLEILSPNYNERLTNAKPNIIVMHYTAMESSEASIEWLCNPASQVSCHYFIKEDGKIVLIVPENLRAWHAGKSFWRGERDINNYSIGIEIQNKGNAPYYAKQIDAIIKLTKYLIDKYKILPHMIIGHSDIAPERKEDPGENFPWQLLAKKGIGLWVDPEPITDGEKFKTGDINDHIYKTQTMLRNFGYKIHADGRFNTQTKNVIIALQRHFRPKVIDGKLDISTYKTLKKLVTKMNNIDARILFS